QSCHASKCQPGHPCVGSRDRLGAEKIEGRSVAGELPATANQAHAAHMIERPLPAETGHAEMKHNERAGHGAEMVRDLRRRFIVSIILSVPIVLFSPMARMFGLPGAPPFGASMGICGLLLATPVVWWGGWPFISAAWRALRRGEVNMMTLIALGILVSYT